MYRRRAAKRRWKDREPRPSRDGPPACDPVVRASVRSVRWAGHKKQPTFLESNRLRRINRSMLMHYVLRGRASTSRLEPEQRHVMRGDGLAYRGVNNQPYKIATAPDVVRGPPTAGCGL